MKCVAALFVCFGLISLSPGASAATVATSTVLAVTPPASAFGASVQLTATVTAASGTATGSVTFYDGANYLGVVALTAPTAVLNTALLGAGNHSLTAQYNGKGNFLKSVSSPEPLTVTSGAAGGFLAAASPAVGDTPVSIAYADFNGDGKIDMVTADEDANNVSVLLGIGDGTFQTAVVYAAGTTPTSVAVADLNGDGTADLVVVDEGANEVSVLLGKGDGTFAAAVTYATGKGPRQVVIADLNHDGLPDLAIACSSKSEVSILLNGGGGVFQAAVNYTIPETPKGLTVGDFNGDGIADLAVANYSGSSTNFVGILLGVGDGTFLAAVNYAVGMAPVAVATADFNADGKADLAVVNSGSNTVSILLGNGDGTFQTAVPYATGSGPFALVVSDLNGDLKPDLVVANNLGGTISVLAGNGDGTFGAATAVPTGQSPLALIAANLNGDSLVDVAVVNSAASTVSVLIGVYGSVTTLSVSPNPSPAGGTVMMTATVTPADATGTVAFDDGTTVLATVPLAAGTASYSTSALSTKVHSLTANYSGSLSVAASSSAVFLETVGQVTTASLTASSLTPALGQPVTFTVVVSPPSATGSVTFLDGTMILGDAPLVAGQATLTTVGLPSGPQIVTAFYGGDAADLTASSNQLAETVNAAAGGGFGAPATYPAGTSPNGAVSGDFNGDGIPDLAVTNYASNNVSILLGNGDGTYQAAVNYAVGTNPGAIAAADVNGDNKLDLIVSNYGSSTVSVLAGNGDGTFQAASSLTSGALPSGITVADFNNDGRPDIAVAASGSNQVSLFLGNGDGTFQTALAISSSGGLKGIATGDFNGDGNADLVVTNGAGVDVMLGHGDGTFGGGVAYGGGTGTVAVAVANLGNGALDLVIVNSISNNIDVLIGHGDGTFGAASPYPVGSYPQSVVLADFNGDGKLDAAVVNEASSNVSVLYGNGDGTFQTAVSYADGASASPVAIVSAPLNGTGQADLVVTNFQTNSVSVLLALQPSSITISATPNPDPTAAQVTITATVAPVAATGTVTFYVGTTMLGTGPVALTAGTASITVTLPAGSDSLTAVYSGDAIYGPSTSPVVIDVVGEISTMITLAISPNPAIFGNPVTLTGNITSPSATGFVTFYSNTSVIGQAPVINQIATLQTLLLPVGSQVVTARFDGDADNATSLSAPVALSVAAQPGFSFLPALTSSAGSSPTSVAAADFNGDGKVDLVVANVGVSVLLNTGAGVFQAGQNISAGSNPTQVVVADFNSDGKPDVAVSDSASNGVSILLGNGDGTFQTAALYGAGAGPSSLTVADFNGDGIPDVATSNRNSGNISVFLGKGDGTLAQATNFQVGAADMFIASGDFNGDGIVDLAVADFTANTVWILTGNGDGTFKAPVANTVGVGPISIAVGDFNHDGKLDLAVANQGSQNVSMLMGVGNGSFQAAVTVNSGAGTQYVATTDFNGDGILDLIVANQAGDVSVLIGLGNGTFNAPASYVVGANPVSIAIANFNGDGRPQAAVASETADSVSVLLDGPATITLLNGSSQTTPAGSNFPALLEVQAYGFGAPAAGVSVLFAAPTSGASGFFAGSGTTATVVSGANGIAFAPILTANGLAGSYNVTASVGTSAVNFALTNSGEACTYSVVPSVVSFADGGGSVPFSVVPSSPSCGWGAASDSPWITLTPGAGTGSGSGTITIAANTSGVERTGNLLIAGFVVPVTEWGTQQIFADVPPSAYYFDAVNLLYGKGITSGCNAVPFDYCPTEEVTRAEMAIFLVRAVYGGDNFTYSPTPYFADVPVGAFGFQWIQKLYELGITNGCSAQPLDYCPNDGVTRDDMAIFLVRTRLGANVPFEYNPVPYFTDVPVTDPAFPYVQRLKQDQVTLGCTATTYCPTETVIRGDMALFIMRGAFNQLLPANYPAISMISPNTIALGGSVTMTVTGVNTNFVQGITSLAFLPGITFGPVTVNSPTSLTVQVTVAANAAVQPYSIVAVAGTEEDVLPNGLIVQ